MDRFLSRQIIHKIARIKGEEGMAQRNAVNILSKYCRKLLVRIAEGRNV